MRYALGLLAFAGGLTFMGVVDAPPWAFGLAFAIYGAVLVATTWKP